MAQVSVLLCSNKIDHYFYMAVDSILSQNFSEIELIVVLNGQAVADYKFVHEKLSQYQNVRLLTSNLIGLNHSLNIGLDCATGKYVARMDADDIAYAHRISTQYKFLENNPDVVICGSWFNLIDSAGKIIGEVRNSIKDNDIRKNLWYKNPLSHPTVMYRRNIVLELGGYQNSQFAEDYDLWVRLARNSSIKFANIPEILLGYRFNSNGNARGAKLAYRAVSTTQWSEFIRTGNSKWLFASLISVTKALFIGR